MNQRLLLRKYDDNIEVVDPQLKNNQDLVNAQLQYEKYWERGKQYFLNGKMCSQQIHFSSIQEGLAEKYKKFSELIDYRDTDIFVMIPMIMILKSCEGDDRGICEFFLPDIKSTDNRLGTMQRWLLLKRRFFLPLSCFVLCRLRHAFLPSNSRQNGIVKIYYTAA